MVLEKILQSPLDYKEIQPVHSKGDQPWDFIFFFFFLAQKEFFFFFYSKNHLLCCKYRSRCTFCHLRGKNVWISEGTYLWLVSMISQNSLPCLPKDQPWDFFSIIPSKEHPGLISFRMDFNIYDSP